MLDNSSVCRNYYASVPNIVVNNRKTIGIPFVIPSFNSFDLYFGTFRYTVLFGVWFHIFILILLDKTKNPILQQFNCVA